MIFDFVVRLCLANTLIRVRQAANRWLGTLINIPVKLINRGSKVVQPRGYPEVLYYNNYLVRRIKIRPKETPFIHLTWHSMFWNYLGSTACRIPHNGFLHRLRVYISVYTGTFQHMTVSYRKIYWCGPVSNPRLNSWKARLLLLNHQCSEVL